MFPNSLISALPTTLPGPDLFQTNPVRWRITLCLNILDCALIDIAKLDQTTDVVYCPFLAPFVGGLNIPCISNDAIQENQT